MWLTIPEVAWTIQYSETRREGEGPRVLLAGLVGAALALAGATYQGLFRNPLADPYLIGVASGAALGATVAIALRLPGGLYALGATQWAAFAGAALAVALVYGLARV